MKHVIAEHLADHALGESHQLSPVEDQHLLRCIRCSRMADELKAILTMSTDPASPVYAVPVDPQIWLAVKARLAVVKQLPRKRGSAASLAGDGQLASMPIIS